MQEQASSSLSAFDAARMGLRAFRAEDASLASPRERRALVQELAWLATCMREGAVTKLNERTLETSTRHEATLRALVHGLGGVFEPVNLLAGLWALSPREYYATFLTGRALSDPKLELLLALEEAIVNAHRIELSPLVPQMCSGVSYAFASVGIAAIKSKHAEFDAAKYWSNPHGKGVLATLERSLVSPGGAGEALKLALAEFRSWRVEHG